MLVEQKECRKRPEQAGTQKEKAAGGEQKEKV